jgi:TonB family protein
MKIRGRTIRTIEGLLLSLLLHLLIFLILFFTVKPLKFAPPPPQTKKISLNLKQITATPPVAPPVPKTVTPPLPKRTAPVPPPPPLPKPVTQPQPKVQKSVKPAPTPPASKKYADDKGPLALQKPLPTEHNASKTAKKPPKKKLKPRKPVPKKHSVRKSHRRKGLAGALMGSGNALSLGQQSYAPSGNDASRMIDQLYGSEFDTFTPVQKKFIRKNLNLIHRITQRTLIQNGYPDIAVRTRQEGTNVVTFYLHPNGNISGLRLQSRIGYTALDQNTLQVIRIAYKGYPRPKTKTKITFYVRYRIY